MDAPRLHVRRTRPCVALCVATSRELESSTASGKHGARGATWALSGPRQFQAETGGADLGADMGAVLGADMGSGPDRSPQSGRDAA